MTVNLLLWLAGVALIVVGYLQARAPYQRYRALQATEENVRRYEDWRGGRRTAAGGRDRSVTGADVMRQELRDRARRWAFVAVAGVVLVFLGFAIR